MAVACALWKAKSLLLEANNIYMTADHKSLFGLYRLDHQLSDVENLRLVNLVEKTSRFKFRAFNVPGKKNKIVDVLSRFPSGGYEQF